MDGFVEHVVEEDGRSNLQDEKMEVMPINILTRMNVVLTVEAESKKMMRMDISIYIRLIMSMVDRLINGDDDDDGDDDDHDDDDDVDAGDGDDDVMMPMMMMVMMIMMIENSQSIFHQIVQSIGKQEQ